MLVTRPMREMPRSEGEALLDGRVLLHGAVAVEVVGGDVHQDADARIEARRQVDLERRHLDHVDAAGGGQELRFDVLYSALGLEYRTGLAQALGAEHDAQGALAVDAHNQTSVKGLYAAGDVARGLDQIVVATEDEPDEARRSRTG